MKEFKFRAWDDVLLKYFKPLTLEQIANGDFGATNWYQLKIEQWTGLYDKHGIEIYEGDIVEAWSQGSKARGVIEQRIDGRWIMYPCWQNSEMWYLMPNEQGNTTVEIIGNARDGISKRVDKETISKILDNIIDKLD